MKRNLAIAAAGLTASAALAVPVDIVGGQTNVALDTATLAAAASLELSSVSADVISPGTLPNSVAFGINPRDAATLPTTFSYDDSDFLGTFSGTIEHSGSVFFNTDTVEVGDFTIGFDANRVGGNASGFFVASNAGIAATLFDVSNPSTLVATDANLEIGADLLVSPEFAQFLLDNQLASADLTGADVGDALVQAIPEPSSLALLTLAGLAALRRR